MQSDTQLFAVLKKEHQEVKDLFEQAKEAEPRRRKALLKQIESKLIPHARGEEKTLYAVLLDKAQKENESEAEDLAREAYEEHRLVDRLLSDLKSRAAADEEWQAKLKVLKENVEHHIKEEEEDLFEKVESLFNEEDRAGLLEAYLAAKERFSETLPTQGQIDERTPSKEARKAM